MPSPRRHPDPAWVAIHPVERGTVAADGSLFDIETAKDFEAVEEASNLFWRWGRGAWGAGFVFPLRRPARRLECVEILGLVRDVNAQSRSGGLLIDPNSVFYYLLDQMVGLNLASSDRGLTQLIRDQGRSGPPQRLWS